jgi:predicted  nucleic acid-binding Zn-ribbon protein
MTNIVDLEQYKKNRKPKVDKEKLRQKLFELKMDRMELLRRYRDVKHEIEDLEMLIQSLNYEIKDLLADYYD